MVPVLAVLLALGASPSASAQAALRPIDPARIAKARNAMRPLGREALIGPWRLLTDAAVGELTGLDAVAGRLSAAWADRYTLAPSAAPEGTELVVIYSSDIRYRRFVEADGGLSFTSRAHAGGGIAAFDLGRTPLETRVLFVHELTHLLNRRAFGDSAPAWLDEGMAEDLAWCRVDADGNLQPDSFDAVETPKAGAAGALEWSGPRVVADAWIRSARAGRIAPLAALLFPGSRLFANPASRRDAVTTSAMLVRWCLGDAERAVRFRGFLKSVARGGAGDGAALASALGLSEADLQRAFLDWAKTL